MIVPAETVQLYVEAGGVPAPTFALNVIGVPGSTASGQVEPMFGQTTSGMQSEQFATVTVVVDEVIQPQPSSTSTEAV